MSYKELKVNWGGEQFVFVTRGRAKPFTQEEAIQYLKGRTQKVAESSNDPMPTVEPEEVPEEVPEVSNVSSAVNPEVEEVKEPNENAWSIPNDRHRRLMFLKDLRIGVDFCVKKYGVSASEIITEARRIAPHLNIKGATDAKEANA